MRLYPSHQIPRFFCQLNGFVSTSSKQTFNVSEL